MPNSGVLVLPMGSTPAAHNRSTKIESLLGRSSRKIGEPRLRGKTDRRFQILEGPGDAVQRAGHVTLRGARVGRVRQCETLLIRQFRHDGIHARIPARNLRQLCLHEFTRR